MPAMRFRTSFFAAVLLSASAASHAQSWGGVELDPHALIRPDLLTRALQAYRRHADKRLAGDKIAIVDFSKPSSRRRLHLLDLKSGAVTSFLVAHGRGSDRDHDGAPETFSDAVGSHASSLGAFRADVRYVGGHGLSLKLDGLDPTNRSARERAVVLHSQWYVSDRIVEQQGKIGRSWGCFVVDRSVIKALVDRLEGGGFLYADR